MKKTLKFLIIIILISPKTFAIGTYKKGDVLYNWKNPGINLRIKPNEKSEIITILPFGERLFVVEENLKKNKFSIQEIAPVVKYDSINEGFNFRGFQIKGFWVKVKTNSGETGYVFDGYLSKLKPDFELNETYFDAKFKLTKSSSKKFPKSISDNAYSKTSFYKNGSYIIQNRSDYVGHEHFFIPNISLEEGYLLVLKSRPYVLQLHKSSGDNQTNYQYDAKELSFTTSLEAISITKITYKSIKGIEIVFEGWD
ncbi:SH3 domain-containing protein [Flavobacterium sp.]|uniref:SH3 domain-containing protein n=1 Tax=Flavobacterium sp. TaxID=239 RepID=UPI00286B8223|nr:SH3 domain-containing protein [Flavobacterium sp.]